MDNSGAKASELRYKPYGEVRYSGLPNGTGTDYRFTGQRQLAGLGLYHMGARWYDAQLGLWISPDTIVPDPANPQSLNRLSYVYNNPLLYRDPSGHGACSGDDYDPACEEDFDPVIWYIYWQMVNNAEGEIIDLLQNWNGSDFTSVWEDMPDWTPGVGEGWNDAALADAGTKAAAFAFFGYMVRQQGPWDPKPEIARLFKYSQEIGGEWYYYDIWGNIMFGYLGAASGFSESALLSKCQ